MLKKKFSGLQSQVGNSLSWIPLHPNHITLLSLMFAALGSIMILFKAPLGVVMFLISFSLEGLDGAIARAKNLTTPFGAYLDGVSDRIVEFFALLPLFFDPTLILPALLTLFFGSCMISFSKAYASHRKLMDNKTASDMTTIFARTERNIGIFLVLVLVVYGYVLEAGILLWALAILSLASFIYLQEQARRCSGKSKRK